MSDGCVCLLHPTTSTSKLLDVVTCGYLLVFLLIICYTYLIVERSVLTLLEKDTTVDWSLLHSKGSLYVPTDASCPRMQNPAQSWSGKNPFVFPAYFFSASQNSLCWTNKPIIYLNFTFL